MHEVDVIRPIYRMSNGYVRILFSNIRTAYIVYLFRISEKKQHSLNLTETIAFKFELNDEFYLKSNTILVWLMIIYPLHICYIKLSQKSEKNFHRR